MKYLALLSLLLPFLSLANGADTSLPFQNGDRIALIGNSLVERDRHYGAFETALQLATGAKLSGLVVRNLGWSGDSVFGDARSYFGPPKEGHDRLLRTIAELKPHVVVFWYGSEVASSSGESWTDETSIGGTPSSLVDFEKSKARFLQGYADLIDAIRSADTDTLREVVLVSPPPLETLPAPLPDQTANNQRLASIRDGIRDLAADKNARFVDIFAALGGDSASEKTASTAPLTSDGVHYGAIGHDLIARELVKGLGYPETSLSLISPDAVAALRSAIIEKDRLFFHRWRPANETYLFLFRKHEQGQNAKEIPEFDPLIDAQQTVIEKARTTALSGLPKD